MHTTRIIGGRVTFVSRRSLGLLSRGLCLCHAVLSEALFEQQSEAVTAMISRPNGVNGTQSKLRNVYYKVGFAHSRGAAMAGVLKELSETWLVEETEPPDQGVGIKPYCDFYNKGEPPSVTLFLLCVRDRCTQTQAVFHLFEDQRNHF
eukprot:1175723-Prorocentrum_minimum.AAC.1